MDTGLQIAGALPRPRNFSLGELKALPRHELGPTEVLCLTGRLVVQVDSYAGVRLIDVLDACGLAELPRADLKRRVVIATGKDGYEAIFSWNELYNSSVGENVLVLFERNSQPLEAHLGELCLISANDTRMGPRHLRELFQAKLLVL